MKMWCCVTGTHHEDFASKAPNKVPQLLLGLGVLEKGQKHPPEKQEKMFG